MARLTQGKVKEILKEWNRIVSSNDPENHPFYNLSKKEYIKVLEWYMEKIKKKLGKKLLDKVIITIDKDDVDPSLRIKDKYGTFRVSFDGESWLYFGPSEDEDNDMKYYGDIDTLVKALKKILK